MVTNPKTQTQSHKLKFLFITLIILAGISNCEKIFSDENISEERHNNRIKAFNDWFKKFNPSSKVEAKLGNDKKIHLIAKSAIKAEENYLSFDRNLTINPDLVYNTKVGGFVKELEESFGYDDNLNMVLFLVNEMGNPKSEWKPYLDVLPRKIDTLAFNYWKRKMPVEEEILHTPFLSKLNCFLFLLIFKFVNFSLILVIFFKFINFCPLLILFYFLFLFK